MLLELSEGVAIGGDRFVGSTFIDNLLRMEKNPDVKYMVLLGEVGGIEEYKVIEAVKSGEITIFFIVGVLGTLLNISWTRLVVQFWGPLLGAFWQIRRIIGRTSRRAKT